MIRFNCDYCEGAHPRILERLSVMNFEQQPGYGQDEICARAADLIREHCAAPDAAVHFLVGGTQTNFTLIAAALRPHQCVYSADTGHINVHEAGAVEATGHKVCYLNTPDGKLTASQVEQAIHAYWQDPTAEHMAQPRMVYISNPTELGTIYTKAELTALAGVCRENKLLLYMDGARLGYGLCAAGNDLTLEDIASCCDAFYIGGTKVGALFGEALVICNPDLQQDFRCIMKQRGAMLAKGWLLGVQFYELFRDDLYWRISAHADELAMRIKSAFVQKGYAMCVDSATNQQFVILPNAVLGKLSEKYAYEISNPVDESHTMARFCTSWATPLAAVDALVADIEKL